MTSFQGLCPRGYPQWLTELKQQIQSILESQAKPLQQIYLFGSRARGNWDCISDTDLLVVADFLAGHPTLISCRQPPKITKQKALIQLASKYRAVSWSCSRRPGAAIPY